MFQGNLVVKTILSVILSLHPTLPPLPAIDVQAISNRAYGQLVTAQLPWSASLRRGADAEIKREATRLNSLLESFRLAGATKVEIRQVRETPILLDQQSLGGFSRFRLSAYNGSVLVSESAAFPIDVKDYGSYLVKISGNSCSLEQWSFFTPSSWFAPRCTVQIPPVSEYLKYSLIAHLNYGEAQDLWNYTINALKYLNLNHIPFKVLDGQLIANFSGFSKGVNAIPLESHIPVGGYVIKVNADLSRVMFIELPPDLHRLARDGKYNSAYRIFSF
jgi:hypothetical protein